MDTTVTIREGGVEVTLRRRTMLSESKAQSLYNKMALFFIELAADLGDDSNAVDIALTKYAKLSSQTVGQVKGVVLANPADDIQTLLVKSRDWLVETNPDIALKLVQALDAVNATWNEPAMAVVVPESADPKP